MNDMTKADEVRIHIDREPRRSPSPTTGAALYALADIPNHRELFREVDGDQEDQLVDRHAKHLALKLDEHFYSQKAVNIIVNAEAKEVVKRRLTFDDVVKLAFENPPSGPNILITVEYGMGPKQNPKGSLRKGESVRVANGMVFDVSATDRS